MLRDIIYVKSELKYVEIYTKDKKFVLRHSLSDFINLLPEKEFIQVHRSYAVNKGFVDYIGPNYLKVSGNEVPYSLQRKEELIKAFNFL